MGLRLTFNNLKRSEVRYDKIIGDNIINIKKCLAIALQEEMLFNSI